MTVIVENTHVMMCKQTDVLESPHYGRAATIHPHDFTRGSLGAIIDGNIYNSITERAWEVVCMVEAI